MVAFVGKPNAGKSTLMNRIVGEKLSIVSPKPQTTRDRVVGIRTTDNSQMVLLDTPGLLDPAYELQEVMRQTAVHVLSDADVIVYVADVSDGEPMPLEVAAKIDRLPRAPLILALNKIDKLSRVAAAELNAEGKPDAMPLSALTGDGVPALVARIESLLPESPFLYPADEISTQSVRFFVAELIRETVLEQLRDEVPYSVACEIEEFREDRSPHFIRAVIYVERESQKGIVVGAKGAAIKKIGEQSRKKIEMFVGERVYLELHVKVLPNWRRDPAALSRLGYQTAKGKE
jgi:GTP-binding protein Era